MKRRSFLQWILGAPAAVAAASAMPQPVEAKPPVPVLTYGNVDYFACVSCLAVACPGCAEMYGKVEGEINGPRR